MDQIDKQLVTQLQTGFAVTERSYAAIGEQLGIKEQEVIDRIKAIERSGEIRRLGASFDPRKLSYSSTFCAVHVPPEKLERTVEAINLYHNVTHNYERNHHYNVWFTLIAPGRDRIEEILKYVL